MAREGSSVAPTHAPWPAGHGPQAGQLLLFCYTVHVQRSFQQALSGLGGEQDRADHQPGFILSQGPWCRSHCHQQGSPALCGLLLVEGLLNTPLPNPQDLGGQVENQTLKL